MPRSKTKTRSKDNAATKSLQETLIETYKQIFQNFQSEIDNTNLYQHTTFTISSSCSNNSMNNQIQDSFSIHFTTDGKNSQTIHRKIEKKKYDSNISKGDYTDRYQIRTRRGNTASTMNKKKKKKEIESSKLQSLLILPSFLPV